MILKALSFRWNANPKSWPFVTPKDPLALFTRAEVWALVSWPNSRWVIKFCLPKIPPVVSAEYSILHFLSKTAVQNCFVLVNTCHISPQRNCCISVLKLSLSLPLSHTHVWQGIAPEHPRASLLAGGVGGRKCARHSKASSVSAKRPRTTFPSLIAILAKPCSTSGLQTKNTSLFLKSWGAEVLLVLLPLLSRYWSYLLNGFIFFAEEEILSPLLLGLVKLLPWGPVDQLLSSKQLWQSTGIGSPAATPACLSYHSL